MTTGDATALTTITIIKKSFTIIAILLDVTTTSSTS